MNDNMVLSNSSRFDYDTINKTLEVEVAKTVYRPDTEFRMKSETIQRNDLAPLTDEWFVWAENYFKKLYQTFIDARGNEIAIVSDEKKNAQMDIEGLYNRRIGKIIEIAVLNSDDCNFSTENMTNSELELYNSIFGLLSSHRKKFYERYGIRRERSVI